MDRYGSLIVNEVILPVTNVRFRAGEMLIEAEGPAKKAAEEGVTEMRLHAPDGSLVFVEKFDMPKCEVDRSVDTITYIFPIRLVGTRWDDGA